MTQAVKHPASHREPMAAGIATFAAVMLVIGGVLGILRGIMAIANDNVFVNTPDYVFEFNVEGWGWIHLALGIVALMTGLSLFKLTLWARVAGVTIAGLLLVSSFLSLPYYPVWSVVLIALYGFVIWALCVARPESADAP
ncbi:MULTISPECIES: hypothetical protein [unclassified Streptomyces]|uniref:DUF7144 family membrane protein n=1 Tax=unclassified Streptomyces TaxID=2593676 RepID=UPI0023ED71A4|nr:hypothetical protein [Streptomyces sp. WMMB303]MDF4251999.1 hypothetical protein [Streptomyces sp. WMMB303]